MNTQNTRIKLNEHELPHQKTKVLHMRKQMRRSEVRAVSAQLIRTFVFATRIVKFFSTCIQIFKLSALFCNCSCWVCVGLNWKLNCWVSHAKAHKKWLISISCQLMDGIMNHTASKWFTRNMLPDC